MAVKNTSDKGKAGKTKDNRNIAIILAVLGVIFVILGISIAVNHNPLSGPGFGTLSFVAGIILLVIGGYLFVKKPA
jgi:uncharacterized membrane protein